MIRRWVESERVRPDMGETEVLIRETKQVIRDKTIITQYIADITFKEDTAILEYMLDNYEFTEILKVRIPLANVSSPMLKWLSTLLYEKLVTKYIVDEDSFDGCVTHSMGDKVFKVWCKIKEKGANDIYAEQFDYFINR